MTAGTCPEKGVISMSGRKTAALFALLVCLMLLCASASADRQDSPDFRYERLQDGTLRILEYTGSRAHLRIPERLDGRPVSKIGRGAFSECSFLVSVTLPQSVTEIDDFAFNSCTALQDISIPNGVTVIGEHAFSRCGRLREVYLPDSVREIGSYAFFRCQMLTDVNIPGSVAKIGNNPFSVCENLLKITVSSDQKNFRIVDGALMSLKDHRLIWYPIGSRRTSFTIPEGTVIIGDEAFYQCQHLKSVTIPNSVTKIGSTALACCLSLDGVRIPDSVTEIGDQAFWGSSLTHITIPDSVLSVGVNPFASCIKLSRVTVSARHPALEIVDGVLYGKKDRRLIWYPAADKRVYYPVRDGTLAISAFAFESSTGLILVSIPASVTQIGDSAFFGCDSVTVRVTSGSCAEQYCITNGLRYIVIEPEPEPPVAASAGTNKKRCAP